MTGGMACLTYALLRRFLGCWAVSGPPAPRRPLRLARRCDGGSPRDGAAHLVDEAWLLADPQTPQALGFLRDLSKRIRKYGGSLVVITQNVVDFLAPELARLGQTVIGNASTKLLMRQESKDMEALRDLLRLTEAECDLLAGARRGEGLLLGGNQHVRVRIEAAAHEVEIMTGAAG